MNAFLKIHLMAATVLLTAISSEGAAGQAELQGKPTTTAYSGPSASRKSALVRQGTENDAITGLVAGERSDDPCHLRVNFRDVGSGAATSLTYDDCEGNEGDLETLSLPEGAFATGVRVCLNNGGDKVKGIQLLGNYGACVMGAEYTYVEPAGCSSVVNISGVEYRLCSDTPAFVQRSCTTGVDPYFERANCAGTKNGPDADWEPAVRCPEGQVAAGMRLNTRESGGGRRMFNGIALDCYDLAAN